MYLVHSPGADQGYKEGGSESGCVMCKAHVAAMGSGGILPQNFLMLAKHSIFCT